MLKIGLYFLILGLPLAGHGASFGGQTEFTATEVQGQFTMNCFEGGQSDFRVAYCHDVILDPFEFAYFEGDKGTGADMVKLHSVQSDGHVVDKTADYDSTKGQSTKRINLWINTLLQTGLLGYGENKIGFELLAGDQSLSKGDFVVMVKDGGLKQCRHRSYSSFNMMDCNNPQIFCNRYFRDQNYCE